jgi:hypothetical protein
MSGASGATDRPARVVFDPRHGYGGRELVPGSVLSGRPADALADLMSVLSQYRAAELARNVVIALRGEVFACCALEQFAAE